MQLFISKDLHPIFFLLNSYLGCFSLVVSCCFPSHQLSVAIEGAVGRLRQISKSSGLK